MEIHRLTLNNCQDADGLVVVIDVLRAFTTAAFAFDRGAVEIVLVAKVSEAVSFKEKQPEYMLMGEVDGLPIPGFDLPNSPTTLAGMDLSGQRLILRTTAGTQGVVQAKKAGQLLAASLCVGTSTAKRIKSLEPKSVTFVETGVTIDGGGDDAACSDYISGMLLDNPPNLSTVKEQVLNSHAAQKFTDPERPEFPKSDLDYTLMIDRFDFTMEVERRAGQLVLRAVR